MELFTLIRGLFDILPCVTNRQSVTGPQGLWLHNNYIDVTWRVFIIYFGRQYFSTRVSYLVYSLVCGWAHGCQYQQVLHNFKVFFYGGGWGLTTKKHNKQIRTLPKFYMPIHSPSSFSKVWPHFFCRLFPHAQESKILRVSPRFFNLPSWVVPPKPESKQLWSEVFK